MNHLDITTLGQLKKAGYRSKSIKEELRANLISALRTKTNPFPGIFGYEDTVIPEMERAILSQHNILLLGLRGQAKTRIARMMTNLLDEYMPFIEGSEIHDDPFNPISYFGKLTVAELGDATPIAWLHRSERCVEKLATPDVSVADLIGDSDPIKAANLRLPYSDERVIHFGLIPRSHRKLFVINELPDLQARIQVSLFNILQEGDVQIRGFNIRLPLDIQFVFTANPEDYTNRGSIVTPLKDRIESQILTHYPKSVEIGMGITEAEAHLKLEDRPEIYLPEVAKLINEQIAFVARKSEFVDQKSGVSARMTIAAMENLISTAERRSLLNGDKLAKVRLSDFNGITPALTGKMELVYEGEQEGAAIVAGNLVRQAIKEVFLEIFPNPEMKRKRGVEAEPNPYQPLLEWFLNGNKALLLDDLSDDEFEKQLNDIPHLDDVLKLSNVSIAINDRSFMKELVLHGLAECSMIGRVVVDTGISYMDVASSMFSFE